MDHDSVSTIVRLGDDGKIVVDGADVGPQSDAASALNAAIRSLPVSGGCVTVTPAVYDISETISIDRPTVLRGVGAGNTTDVSNMTILHATDELEGPVVEVRGRNAPGGFMHGTRIADLGIVGNERTGTANDCLRFTTDEETFTKNIVVCRTMLDSAGRHGIHFESLVPEERNVRHAGLRNVWSGHHSGDGISLADGRRYWLTNCYGYDSTVGIRVSEPASDVSLVVPHCRRNDEAGLFVGGGPTQVHGGRFVDNDGSGIVVRGTEHTTIAHAETFNNTEAGVVVGGSEERTEQTLLTGIRSGNLGGGTEVDVRPTSLPRRLAELGPRGAVEKLRKYGLTNVLSGYLPGGTIDKSQYLDIDVCETAVDTRITRPLSASGGAPSIRDRGVRTLVDGVGRCRGNPVTDELWSSVRKEGAHVVDTESDELYIYAHDGWYGPVQST